MNMRIISFCLWGNKPQYIQGMHRNIELAADIYPGWQIFLYHGELPPYTIEDLTKTACESNVSVRFIAPGISDWRLMLHRFRAATDSTCDVMISRDADSRLSRREATAVVEWLDSGCGVHTMHDHPHHTVPILGGLWGIKRGYISDINGLIDKWLSGPLKDGGDYWQVDQEFLTQRIWPLVRLDILNHDSFFRHNYGGVPFPTERRGTEFVGATIDEHEMYVPEQVRILQRYL